MQEIVLLLTGIAGAASAAAYRKIPRGRQSIPSIGASPRIRNKIHLLEAERDMLTKTISRLHREDSGLSSVQKDRLVSRYQHQLGVILASIDKMNEAGRHPDLGAIGDGLVTLMDQKLSTIDARLHELSSKITVAGEQWQRRSSVPKIEQARPEPAVRAEVRNTAEPAPRKERPVELTTLTTISAGPVGFPKVGGQQVTPPAQQMTLAPLPEPAKLPAPQRADVEVPVDDIDDDADITKITGDIKKILAKLDQSEVE